MNKWRPHRFVELDLWRGVAVIGMIIFHVFFILDFYGVLENDMRAGWWHVLGQLVRFSFLGLVGVGMVISYDRLLAKGCSRLLAVRWQWRRGVLVFASGMLVSLVTAIFLPEAYVQFGILHLIGFSILVLSFLLWNSWLALVFGMVAFFLPGILGTETFFLLVRNSNFNALDYFPIFPWIGVVALGIFLGKIYLEIKGDVCFAKAKGLNLKKNFFIKGLAAIGRHSLLIYLIHVPIILALFILFGVLNWKLDKFAT